MKVTYYQNNISLILKALDFAAKKHRDQRRKDSDATPYINHPIEVAELLVNEGNIHDDAVIIAALLHDTVEDTETTIEELAEEFTREIADIVAEVTDDKSLKKAERKQLQVENTATSSKKAKLVKLADKICNLRDMKNQPPENWDVQRKQEYFDWAKEVINQVNGVNENLEKMFNEIYMERPG